MTDDRPRYVAMGRYRRNCLW